MRYAPLVFSLLLLSGPALAQDNAGESPRQSVTQSALPPLESAEIGAAPGADGAPPPAYAPPIYDAAPEEFPQDASGGTAGEMNGSVWSQPAPAGSQPADSGAASPMADTTVSEVDQAGDDSAPERLIDRARIAVSSMLADKNYPLLRDLLQRSKAVLIAPSVIRLGFFLGGRGGTAVMLARDASGSWSAPAFYTLGGGSFGFQIGAQSSEIVLCIVSEKGLRAVMDNEFTIGAEAGVAVLDVGAGAHAATGLDTSADMYAFSRSDGLYVGISLDGTVITSKDSYNHTLYGPGATPEAILLNRSYSAPQASRLISVLP